MPSVDRYWKRLHMWLLFLCFQTVRKHKQCIEKVQLSFPVRASINTLIMWLQETSDLLLFFSLLSLIYHNLKSIKNHLRWFGDFVPVHLSVIYFCFYKVNLLYLYPTWIELIIRSSFSPRCEHWNQQQWLAWAIIPTDTTVAWILG